MQLTAQRDRKTQTYCCRFLVPSRRPGRVDGISYQFSPCCFEALHHFHSLYCLCLYRTSFHASVLESSSGANPAPPRCLVSSAHIIVPTPDREIDACSTVPFSVIPGLRYNHRAAISSHYVALPTPSTLTPPLSYHD